MEANLMKKLTVLGLIALLAVSTVLAMASIEVQEAPADPGMVFCDAVKGAFSAAYYTVPGNPSYSEALDFVDNSRIDLSDLAYFGRSYASAKSGSIDNRIWCKNVLIQMLA
jgi:hypothetical protein